ncbi:MAG: hypothetical protein KAG66_02645 [Methylococcales bacterium]|nr:hypothetical protein [Methylococcales bacterium]
MSKGHSFDQVLNLKQTTILAPQLQQGVHLLQLSSIELQNEIDIALASNPFLEKLELEFSPEPLKADALIQQNSKLDRRSDLGSSRAIQGRSSNASSVLSVPRSDSLQGHRASDAGEMPVFQLAEEQTLQTHLQQQARSTPLNAKQHHILE